MQNGFGKCRIHFHFNPPTGHQSATNPTNRIVMQTSERLHTRLPRIFFYFQNKGKQNRFEVV